MQENDPDLKRSISSRLSPRIRFIFGLLNKGCDQGLKRAISWACGSNSIVITCIAVLAASMAVYPRPVVVSSTYPLTGAIALILLKVSLYGFVPLIRCIGIPEINMVGADSVGIKL